MGGLGEEDCGDSRHLIPYGKGRIWAQCGTSPHRSGEHNLATTCALSLSTLACLFQEHSHAASWLESSFATLRTESMNKAMSLTPKPLLTTLALFASALRIQTPGVKGLRKKLIKSV